ncbi:HEAT repeat domain-containing protein [Candidatus Haliotispira prima]|uniref:HEAT repeat domain-containing protein n=1 Tax=Candidatus Haliotispira prima TaxID=3034016 RepID=A0ABY8MH11_9SPIO|nr:HEAT repeat domain-containing protein [Candidatus Haliotispira prima]
MQLSPVRAQDSAEPPSLKNGGELGGTETKADAGEEARKEAERQDKQIRQTISYGIDSDLVTVIQTLLREAPRMASDDDDILWIEKTPYNDDIYRRIKKGYSSSDLQTKAIHFFMQQKWLGAEPYVIEIVDRSFGKDNVDDNLVLAALAYLQRLEVKGSEKEVMSLLSDENPQVVERSLTALGKIGSGAAAAKILEMLKDEDNSFLEFTDREREVLRVAGIAAMGSLVYEAAAEYLLAILEDAKNEEPEYSNAEWGASAKALGRMARVEAVGLVLEQFQNGGTQERYQAVIALSSFPPQAEFEDIILQGLQEAYWKTREEAAKTAGELTLRSAIPGLVYKVSKDSVVGVRRAAIKALRQMGDSGNSALRGLMEDPDARETPRLDVLRILIKARDENAIGILHQLLSDSDNQFKLSRTGIFRVAGNDPWSMLDFVYREMLSGGDQRTRRDALRAIGRARMKSLQDIVEELAENGEDSVIRRAAKATLTALSSKDS